MSNYPLAPSPTFGRSEHPFVTWRGAFTDEELDQLVSACSGLCAAQATVGDGEVSHCIRKSQTAWLNSSEFGWLYERLGLVARQVNGQFYGFDLYGFSEDMQFTIYEGDGGHYTWHQDSNAPGNMPPRKLTLVVQLSDPADYEGGDLQILSGADPSSVDKERGLVTAFPAYMLHRVTPVTKGVRKTIVVWITGPAFR